MSEATPRDPHQPYVAELARKGDWVDLLLYWMAHGPYEPALDAALAVVERRAVVEGGRFVAWAEWLRQVRENPLQLFEEEPIAEHADERERAISRLLWLLPCVVLCDTAGQFDPSEQAELLGMGLAAAEQASQVADAIGHGPALGFFRFLAARGFEEARQSEQARAAYEEALGIRRALARHRPEVYEPDVAMTLNNLGVVYGTLNRADQARAAYEEARERYRALAGRMPEVYTPLLGATLNNLGTALRDLNRPEQALAAFEEVLGIRRTLAERSPEVHAAGLATTLNNLGVVLGLLNRLEQAREAHEEALSIRRALAERWPEVYTPLVPETLNGVGNALSKLDRLEPALAAYEEALRRYRDLARHRPEVYTRDVAGTLNNLANVLNDLSRPEQARGALEEALGRYRALARRSPEVYSPLVATTLGNLGQTLGDLGRLEQALAAHEEALGIRRALAERSPEVYTPEVAVTLNNLGTALGKLGRLEQARAAFQEALDIRRALAARWPEVYTPDVAMTLNNLGNVLRQLDRPEQARDAYEEAARCYARNAADRPTTFLAARRGCHANLAQLYLGQEPRLGWPDHRKARDSLRQARACAETLRFLFADAGERERVQTEAVAIYDDLVRANVALRRIDPLALTEALLVAESGRARNLMELLADQELTPAAPADLVERFRSLRQRHRQLARAYRDEQLRAPAPPAPSLPEPAQGMAARGLTPLAPAPTPPPADRLAAARDEFERVQRDYLQCLQQIRARHDPGFDPDAAVQPITFEQARSLLPDPSTAIVQYCLTADQGLALVLTSAGVEAVELPDLTYAQGRDLAARWFAAYGRAGQRGDLAAWAAAMPDLLAPVAGRAVRPVWHALAGRGIGRLILCPSRGLQAFPLHACALDDGRPLSDACEVVYTPSLSILHRSAVRPRPRPERLLLIQDPTDDLPGTRVESAALAAHYPARQVITGAEATRETLLRAAADSEVLHYAGHAFFDGKQPLRSGLVLQGRHPDHQARWLSLADLFTRLHLPRNSLTVLSGCESGLVESKLVDEYVGLPSGFLYAGARCVVSTLWAVSDLSSALLMGRFHEAWRGGQPVAAALHAAQRWLRDIPTRRALLGEVLPTLLAALPDGLKRQCLDQARRCPETRPFASPAYWAPYIAIGLAYPLPQGSADVS